MKQISTIVVLILSVFAIAASVLSFAMLEKGHRSGIFAGKSNRGAKDLKPSQSIEDASASSSPPPVPSSLPKPPQTVTFMPETFAEIDKQIARLRQEDLDQSLGNLIDPMFFIWPGMSGESPSLVLKPPLATTIDTHALRVVLSNRRVMKVIQELNTLDPALASAKTQHALDLAYNKYEVMQSKEWTTVERAIATTTDPLDLTWGTAMLTDGEYQMPALRNEIFALSLAAADGEMKDLFPAIKRIAEAAAVERNAAYEAGRKATGQVALCYLADSSIYNRAILATALLKTAPVLKENYEPREFTTLNLTAYDARLTPFDQPVGYGQSPDYSQGTFPIEILTGVDDAEFDELLAALP
ncbi:MAG: hypothetical protein HYV26_13675 [Candidatus Hydrogenedentes bacterium]|nr:hypothetical protein [Candidatus Hydrogenedentota bacterium]